MGEMSKEIRSEINSDGLLTLSISSSEIPRPKDHEVLIKVEASPINPSDLGLLISFAADVTSLKVEGEGDDKKATMNVHPKLLRTMQARLDKSMQVGNEGAGVIVDAGKDAKEMIGKTVGVAGGAMYSQYRCLPAQSCLVMHEGTSSKDAASSFVNPLTALGFIETMKMENHSSLVHTAAASNLGQMLIKICLADNIPLVNIVRKEEHDKLLKGLGATHVCNFTNDNFMESLIDAIAENSATLGFDATGGKIILRRITIIGETKERSNKTKIILEKTLDQTR